MSKYFDNLSALQYTNIGIVIACMKKKGITNKFAQSAILSIISKESNFLPSFEKGYSTTPNERIKSIFAKTRNLSDVQLNELKKDNEKFFNFVYGGMFGNAANEGFKYRGGGFNQITFKGNYAQASKDTGKDLITNPELINDPENAANAVISYFLRRFKQANRDINNFNDLGTAINDVYAANAGKLGQKITSDPTGGFAIAGGRAAGFYEYVKKQNDSLNFLRIKAHFLKYWYIYLIVFLLVISFIVYKMI